MQLKNEGIYPLIKIKTPSSTSFFDAHKACIENDGFVWFCRFGKNNMKIDSLNRCEHILFIKESGVRQGGVYIAEYVELSEQLGADKTGVPEYYNTLSQPQALWIKLISLNPFDYKVFMESFVVNSSGGSVDNILRSMCPAFFLKSIVDHEI